MIWLGLLAIASVLIWLAVFVRVRLIESSFPALDASTQVEEPSGGLPFLSLIVPARNEERDIESCLQSLIRQDYPAFELIFVDDESTDRTLERARRILDGQPNGKVVTGKPRPSGSWIGKSWALVQGVTEARGDWLVFIDSDVVHHPLALRQAAALAFQMKVDALSVLPAIECRSVWEKIIMPLFALLSILVVPPDHVNHPDKSSSRLSGAFILIRRSIYEAAGGHRAISDQILEDMALARNLKEKGCRLWLTYTHDLTSTRMYDNFYDLWLGLTRLSFPMMNYNLLLLGVSWAAAFFGCLVPWLAAIVGLYAVAVHGAVLAGAGLAVAGGASCLGMLVVLKHVCALLKVAPAFALLLPFGALVYCLAGTHSAIRHYSGRGLGWKQRLYRKSS